VFEGTHYPTVSSACDVDEWVTHVYQPGRSRRLEGVEVARAGGNRGECPEVRKDDGCALLGRQIVADERRVMLWVHEHGASEEHMEVVHQVTRRMVAYGLRSSMKLLSPVVGVLAYTLAEGRDTPLSTLGPALERHTVLARVLYPRWRVRVYVHPSLLEAGVPIDGDVDEVGNPKAREDAPVYWPAVLREAGAEVVAGDTSVPAEFWVLEAGDDMKSSGGRVLYRHPLHDLTLREAAAVDEWVDATCAARSVHAMRDSWRYRHSNIPDGLWGMCTGALPELLQHARAWWARSR
jgi:hypothetical protein